MSAALATVTPPADLARASASVRALVASLDSAFVGRRDEIRAVTLALVAREHVLLLGDPGTGKSALTQAFCASLGGNFFQILMTRFTVPEEILGPVSLKGLEQDQYRRVVAGMLPAAQVAFLDEVFKANSAILNSLLTLLNERAYDDGGQRHRAPLEICIGASNEMPESDALAALYDRFLVRRWVAPVKDRDDRRRILRLRGEPSTGVALSAADLAVVRAAAEQVVVPESVEDVILDLTDALAQEHGITVSDRRSRKLVKLVRANAAIDGRMVATPSDCMVLVDATWRTPDERAKIMGTMARLVSPDLAAALRVLDAAQEAVTALGADLTAATVTALGAANSAIKGMMEEVGRLHQSPEVAAISERVRALHVSVGRAALKKAGF